MSKSLGNGIDPKDVVKQMGADILRLWAASADYKKDISVSDEIFKQVTESYRKIRNTLRFLHGNLYDYSVSKDKVEYEKLLEIDKYILIRLNDTIKKAKSAFDNYEFYMAFNSIHQFCILDLSALYLDVIKDRVYGSLPESIERRSAQTVIFEILKSLMIMLTPILSFTMEEIYDYLDDENKVESVQLLDFPVENKQYENSEISLKWNKLLEIREHILKVLEKGRQDALFGNSLGAKLLLATKNEDLYKFLKDNEKVLLDISIVSRIEISNSADFDNFELFDELFIKAENIKEEKCERCWMHVEGIGQDEIHPTLCPRCSSVIKEIE